MHADRGSYALSPNGMYRCLGVINCSRRCGVVVIAVTLAIVIAAMSRRSSGTACHGGDDDPSVAVITLRERTTDANVNAVKQDLREARTNESIEAVVLRVDSPGGPVDSSEEFYLAVNRTASEMPVSPTSRGRPLRVGTWQTGDEIVVKPSSNVGSRRHRPGPAESHRAGRTAGETSSVGAGQGPNEATSPPEETDSLEQAWLGDGTPIGASKASLSVAQPSVSRRQATEIGFADRIGDTGLAIERAAALSDDIEATSTTCVSRQRRCRIHR